MKQSLSVYVAGASLAMLVTIPAAAQDGERKIAISQAAPIDGFNPFPDGQVSTPPEVDDLTVYVDAGSFVRFQLTGYDADGDSFQFVPVMPPEHGILEEFEPDTGRVLYRPNLGWQGEDTLYFVGSDGLATSTLGRVTIHVAEPNDAPVFVQPTPAEGEVLTFGEGERVVFRVVAHDVDGDPVTYGVDRLPSWARFSEGGVFKGQPRGWRDAGQTCLTVVAAAGPDAIDRSFCVEVRATDRDEDGLPDGWEATVGLDPRTTDSDGDGIPDRVEAAELEAWDTDRDGVIDALDEDSDNDGLKDLVEAGARPDEPVDTDGDGVPDFRDLDSDDDGVIDRRDRCPTEAARTFNGCASSAPAAPELLWPADGAELRSGKVRLEAGSTVDPDGDAVFYIFRVYTHPTHSRPLAILTVPQNLEGVTEAMVYGLTDEEPMYYWSVTPVDVTGAIGEESGRWCFSMRGASAATRLRGARLRR